MWDETVFKSFVDFEAFFTVKEELGGLPFLASFSNFITHYIYGLYKKVELQNRDRSQSTHTSQKEQRVYWKREARPREDQNIWRYDRGEL